MQSTAAGTQSTARKEKEEGQTLATSLVIAEGSPAVRLVEQCCETGTIQGECGQEIAGENNEMVRYLRKEKTALQ